MTHTYDSAVAELVAQLVKQRHLARLSQREVARLVKITQAALSRIEQGRVDPRLSTVLQTAHALELELRLVPRRAIAAVDSLLNAVPVAPGEEPSEPALYSLHDGDELS